MSKQIVKKKAVVSIVIRVVAVFKAFGLVQVSYPLYIKASQATFSVYNMRLSCREIRCGGYSKAPGNVPALETESREYALNRNPALLNKLHKYFEEKGLIHLQFNRIKIAHFQKKQKGA